MTKSFTISGFTIKTASPVATTNPRFFSQKQLFALGTAEALAELNRRAAIIRASKEA